MSPANRRAGEFSPARFSLSKKWRKPLFRGFHSSLAPTARPGSYAGKPLLRKAFCGFDAHVAKSDYSLWGLRPPNPRGFFDRLSPRGAKGPPGALCALRAPAAPLRRPGPRRRTRRLKNAPARAARPTPGRKGSLVAQGAPLPGMPPAAPQDSGAAQG